MARDRMLRKAFLADIRGGIALTFALAAPVLILLVLGAVGTGIATNHKMRLQGDLDAMALDAANVFLAHSTNEREATALIDRRLDSRLAEIVAEKSVYSPLSLTREIDFEKKQVDVHLKGPIVIDLLRPVLGDALTLDVTSTAVAEVKTRPVCILALGTDAPTALTFSGSGRVKAKDCVIWGDSGGFQSIAFNGGGKIESERLCTVGRAGSPGRYTVSPAAEEHCDPVADPLAHWSPPESGPCTSTDSAWIAGNTVHLTPGVYCAGLRVSAKNLFIDPGIYEIRGPLILRGEAKIRGKGVGFYLTGPNANVEIDGDGAVELTSPTTGKMSGIVLAADRASTVRQKSMVSGRVDLKIGGVIYAPQFDLLYWGDSDTRAASPVTTLIARTIEIGGDAYLEVRNDKEKAPYAPVVETGQGDVRLVR